MKTTALLIAFLSFQLNAIAQEKPAYNIFTNEGRKVYYEEMLKGISDADIILFGEIHDDPVAHWLELEITRSLAGMKGKSLVMGAEMFETDNQLIIDEYLEGQYALSKFEAEAKLWNNYSTDYRPLLEFAAEKSIPFVATNIPRRYASIVARKGFEGLDNLSSDAKKYFPPLPIQYDPDLKGYKDMTEMGGMGTDSIMHENLNFPKAQAVKDATMAYFILRNWSPGKIFIHFNGAYHSRNYEGIVWYLKKSNPDLKIATIETLNQENIEKPAKSYANRASFIILIPSSMTRTF
jgi:uncharacterized iron-regulated protein